MLRGSLRVRASCWLAAGGLAAATAASGDAWLAACFLLGDSSQLFLHAGESGRCEDCCFCCGLLSGDLLLRWDLLGEDLLAGGDLLLALEDPGVVFLVLGEWLGLARRGDGERARERRLRLGERLLEAAAPRLCVDD